MTHSPVPTDEELLLRVATGERSAFQTLVRRHERAVFAVAYRYLGNAADAEEVAQEAFIRLYDAAPRYEPRARFRTFLLRIVANLALNRRARHHRRFESQTDPSATVLTECPSIDPTPEQAHATTRHVDSIRTAIEALPDDQRMVLVLTRFEGLSYEEVATVLDRSVGAITSLLWRARRELRATLVPPLDEPAQGSCASAVRTKGPAIP